jgi:hypothetical protein
MVVLTSLGLAAAPAAAQDYPGTSIAAVRAAAPAPAPLPEPSTVVGHRDGGSRSTPADLPVKAGAACAASGALVIAARRRRAAP